MEKIASFKVDHRKFGVGMYISRIDGDIVTYDVRMVKPNGGNTYQIPRSTPLSTSLPHTCATILSGRTASFIGVRWVALPAITCS